MDNVIEMGEEALRTGGGVGGVQAHKQELPDMGVGSRVFTTFKCLLNC